MHKIKNDSKNKAIHAKMGKKLVVKRDEPEKTKRLPYHSGTPGRRKML